MGRDRANLSTSGVNIVDIQVFNDSSIYVTGPAEPLGPTGPGIALQRIDQDKNLVWDIILPSNAYQNVVIDMAVDSSGIYLIGELLEH